MPEFRDTRHSRAPFPTVIEARNGLLEIGPALAEGLRECDAIHVPGALPADQTAALRAEAELAHANGRFAAARIGRETVARDAVRSDELCWLGAAPHAQERDGLIAPAAAALLTQLDALRVVLDRALLLGTHSVEAQYARYAPGTHYARHVDRLSEDAAAGGGRVLSLVLYLNAGWIAADGGALRLYDAAGEAHDVLPQAGTLVAFLSDRVVHEVLPATRPRWSVAAWLRRAG